MTSTCSLNFFSFSLAIFTLVLCNFDMCKLNLHMLSARNIQHPLQYLRALAFVGDVSSCDIDKPREKRESMLNLLVFVYTLCVYNQDGLTAYFIYDEQQTFTCLMEFDMYERKPDTKKEML